MEVERRCEPSAAPFLTRPCAIIAAILLLALFGLASWSESMMLPPMDDSDEPAYFDEACWIAEHGGPIGFVRECLQGNYPYSGRHPLIPVLASPWARRSLDAVRPMRAVHVAVSVASLAAVFALACRMAGPEAALFLTALLSLSINWYAKSRVLTAEPVIYAAFFAAWALIAGKVKPRWRWFLAGAMVGLAYLAKGTAMLILFAFPVAWAAWGIAEWRRRRGGLASAIRCAWRPILLKSALPFLAGALLLAGPLLARNAVRFGNPLSNFNDKVIWLDSWTEHVLLSQDDLKETPSLGRYLRAHSLKEIAGRVAFGIENQTPRFLGRSVHTEPSGSGLLPVYVLRSDHVRLALHGHLRADLRNLRARGESRPVSRPAEDRDARALEFAGRRRARDGPARRADALVGPDVAERTGADDAGIPLSARLAPARSGPGGQGVFPDPISRAAVRLRMAPGRRGEGVRVAAGEELRRSPAVHGFERRDVSGRRARFAEGENEPFPGLLQL
jgi:hypothetical protein